MGKTLVRASHRKYKKNAKGYTKRKIIIKKSRHTRNRRGGKLTADEKDKAHQLKNHIKVQLRSLLEQSSGNLMDTFLDKDNQKAYMEAFGFIFDTWYKFTDEQKEYFKKHFLDVGWGHDNRTPVYQSILADLEIHELCKDGKGDKERFDCFTTNNEKHSMISNLRNKYDPGNTDSTSVVPNKPERTKADEAYELTEVARSLRGKANSLHAAFKNAEAAYNKADSEASDAEKKAHDARIQVPLDI